MPHHCETCGDVFLTEIKQLTETYSVQGKSIEVKATVRLCGNCDKPIYDRELDSKNIEEAYRIYDIQTDSIG